MTHRRLASAALLLLTVLLSTLGCSSDPATATPTPTPTVEATATPTVEPTATPTPPQATATPTPTTPSSDVGTSIDDFLASLWFQGKGEQSGLVFDVMLMGLRDTGNGLQLYRDFPVDSIFHVDKGIVGVSSRKTDSNSYSYYPSYASVPFTGTAELDYRGQQIFKEVVQSTDPTVDPDPPRWMGEFKVDSVPVVVVTPSLASLQEWIDWHFDEAPRRSGEPFLGDPGPIGVLR